MPVFQATFTLYKTFNLRIQPLLDKIMTITNLPEPKNIDELHHVLGLTGYDIRFIPLFADITKPLNKPLRKDTIFH